MSSARNATSADADQSAKSSCRTFLEFALGAMHGCSAAAVALAWAIRSGNVIAIPESGSAAHVRENAVALSVLVG